MSFQAGARPWFSTGSPYEELVLAFDPTAAEQRVKRRRRRFVSRVISLVITVAIMTAIYLWQREQFAYAALWVIYGIALGVSLAFVVVALVGWLQSRRILASVGQGLALRIGRPGVEITGAYVPWSELGSIAVAKGRLGHGPQLRVTRADGYSLSMPLDQLDVYPATLDTTARAYSGGRFGVDLTALEN